MKILKSGIQNFDTYDIELRTIVWSQADLGVLYKAAALLSTARERITENFVWEEPDGSHFITAEAFLSEMLAEGTASTTLEMWRTKEGV